ncbi:hypothetical protein BDFB_000779 [Asbolus verrucosus]|uniref:Uncharacterized protein n=1 Tax=Asbolus verrucosus TaxID=1661398 RepID=A0A482WCN7_ASBVE|nr:hypothetical protein BDFB_000779 [Asbolus verrucosus]
MHAKSALINQHRQSKHSSQQEEKRVEKVNRQVQEFRAGARRTILTATEPWLGRQNSRRSRAAAKTTAGPDLRRFITRALTYAGGPPKGPLP